MVSANICQQHALRGDQDPSLRLLPLLKIPGPLGHPARASSPRARGCRLLQTMWPFGASGGRDLGGRGPRAAMRPRSTLGHAACDPEGSLPWGALPVPRPPPPQRLRQAGATPPPLPPTVRQPPPIMPSHRIAPSPTSRGRAAPGPQRPRYPCPGGPIWPLALAPAWPPGGLSRVAASRLAVPRPASLQRHRASPNRHPARQPGRAPAPLRTSRRSPAEPVRRRPPLPSAPSPTPAPFHLLPGPNQGTAHARPARSHLARTH